MTQFFKKFPVINYSNTSAVNIFARVNMSKLALTNKSAFYTYVIPEGMKPEHLSYNYYSNPDYIWLINLSNKIIDPYYDYPLSDSDLNSLIAQKYGSISNAQSTILYFTTNWISDDSIISPAAYAALPVSATENLQKYWAPQIDNNNNIYAYVRKQEDWISTTNQVQQLNIVNGTELLTEDGVYTLETEEGYDLLAPNVSTTSAFIVGEQVSQNGYTIGTIVSVNSDFIIIQHISGQVVNGISTIGGLAGYITGLTSGASTLVTSVTTLSQNIPQAEFSYWTIVTAYQYEVEKNAFNKNIQLLDNNFAAQATKELKNLLLTTV